jgi:predicted HD phosphohydrolase
MQAEVTSRGVVRQAHRASQVLREEDRPYLIVAAWLHDIGDASSIATTWPLSHGQPGLARRQAAPLRHRQAPKR